MGLTKTLGRAGDVLRLFKFIEKLLFPIRCDEIKSKDCWGPSESICSGIPFDLILQNDLESEGIKSLFS